jgi:hypothetical protein
VRVMTLMTSNVGLVGHLAVLLLALNEWGFVFLYVYCLKRFHKNFRIKLISAALAILASLGAVIAQRQIYQPVRDGGLFVNEFNVVVMAEKTVSLTILFYGIRKSGVKSQAVAKSHDSA